MEDRIQINGVWYIKEEPDAIPEPQKELDLAYAEMCSYELQDYCFEATRMFKDYDQDEFYSDTIDIKFTDKRTKPWKIHNWDGVDWLRGVFDNDKRAINEALEIMDEDGVKELKAFIGELIEKGWIMYFNCENIHIGKNKSGKDRRIPGVGC
jgi:hypothetical protein